MEPFIEESRTSVSRQRRLSRFWMFHQDEEQFEENQCYQLIGKIIHILVNFEYITVYPRTVHPETVYPQKIYPQDSLSPKQFIPGTVYPQRQFIPRDSLSPRQFMPRTVYTWDKLSWG